MCDDFEMVMNMFFEKEGDEIGFVLIVIKCWIVSFIILVLYKVVCFVEILVMLEIGVECDLWFWIFVGLIM